MVPGALYKGALISGRCIVVAQVIHASIGGTRIIGRVCVGNKHGLLVPSITTDNELQHLRLTGSGGAAQSIAAVQGS